MIPTRISTITPTDNARLLGVSVSADLSLQNHVSTVSARCFYQLRQIRCTRQSLDKDSLTALIHAFVFSRIDYCCSLLTRSSNVVTDKLQLNAAARVVINSRKYDRGLTYARRHELHWLDVPERIQFRVAATVHRCLKGLAPVYLSELCIPPAQNQSRHRLRSSHKNKLVVPSVKLSTYGSHSFAFSGPTVWNKLPDYLRYPSLSVDIFNCSLLTDDARSL